VLLSQAAPVLAQPWQSRVTGTCPAGSSIRTINPDGSVVCQVGGTVTSVATGSGLTGGPITTTGTISIPTGGVTSAHIADGTIAAVDVNSGQVQLRVTGTCPADSAIRVVDQGGTVTCQPVGSGTVTAVTASAPLVSSGGTTPNIALPNVFIEFNNMAIGGNALGSNNTGGFNTASGFNALARNSTGVGNTASGARALLQNTQGREDTAIGESALFNNTTGSNNTVIGAGADVAAGDLSNATAIGFGAFVDASDKIRLGNFAVTVIEGAVDFTFPSDQTKKENFQPVDGEAVLEKLRGLNLTSWNYIGHDPKQFRHYGPMGQEFFAAFGHDGVGTIGTPTTLTSGDVAGILMSAVQAMEKRTMELRQETQRLKESVEAFKAENAELKARLDKAERTTIGHVTTSSR
jgi:hypothetical protein